ncbi:MAG: DUF418 domain-containing protein [Acidobacteria bacterium]|nr:DUF418 domain-containing protein [Acidobacteriota bacterium]
MPPTSPSLKPVAPEARLLQLDVLRGLALLGVLLVNLSMFSGSEWAIDAHLPYPMGWGGKVLQALTGALLESKSAALLAMLFGAGLTIQAEALTRRGERHLPFSLRRVGTLALLGLAHSFLLWDGDILLDYALISLLMLPVLHVSARRILWTLPLLWAAAGLLILPFAGRIGAATDLLEQAARFNALSAEHYGAASWLATLKYRAWEMVHVLGPVRLANRLPILLPFFVLGAYFWKKGFFSEPERHGATLRRMALVFGLLGLAANLFPQELVWSYSASFSFRPLRILVRATYFFAKPGLTLGYAAGILLLLQHPVARKALGTFAPLGRMALTQYLLQSLICTWIFNGHGLGLYGKVPISHYLMGGMALFALQVWSSRLWLARFRMGPAEWLWRRLTYGSPQAFRLRPTIPATAPSATTP